MVTEEPITGVVDQPESETGGEAYPVAPPPVPTVVGSSAYPITNDDIQLLIGAWSLTQYSENDISMKPGARIIKFFDDGTYEVTTDAGTRTGTWVTKLYAVESNLILDPGTENPLTFEILDLSPSVLNLRITLNGVEINEGYLPAE